MESKIEQFLIGALLLNPDDFQEVSEIISEKDFKIDLYRHAFLVIKRLLREKQKVELANLYLEMGRPFGFSSIAESFDDVIFPASYYAKLLKKRNIDDEIKKSVKQRDFEKTQEMIKKLGELGEPVDLFNLQKMFESQNFKTEKFETGLKDLDQYLVFQPGDLFVIAGKPSTGKTALGIQILGNMAKEFPVGLISFEMSLQSIAKRMALMFSLNYLNEINENFIAASPPIFSVSEVRKTLRDMLTKKQIRVAMIDYLQLMQEQRKFESRRLEVTHIIRSLKEIARELNLGLIVISSLARQAESDKVRPHMGLLKESGDIEYSADIIVFLHASKDENRFELILEKNRNGEAKKIINLVFLNKKICFGSWEYREDWFDKVSSM